MTAKEAKQLTDEINQKDISKEMVKVEKLIKEACKNGEYNVDIYNDISQKTMESLINQGYHVNEETVKINESMKIWGYHKKTTISWYKANETQTLIKDGFVNRHETPLPMTNCKISIIINDSTGERIELCDWFPRNSNIIDADGHIGTARTMEGTCHYAWEGSENKFIFYRIEKQ